MLRLAYLLLALTVVALVIVVADVLREPSLWSPNDFPPPPVRAEPVLAELPVMASPVEATVEDRTEPPVADESVLASFEVASESESAEEAPPEPDLGTHIAVIRIDLTSPMHAVTLEWAGPEAAGMPTGPFQSSPGAGLGYNNCDDHGESNRNGSNCTPKGDFVVEGFSDYLPSHTFCRHVTWFHLARGIAIHSHYQVPRYPASHGCVRMHDRDAKLIHDNAKKGVTRVVVSGRWTR